MGPSPFPLMHPTLVPRPIHHPGWVYEEKVDGYRMVAHKTGTAVQLISRQGKAFTQRFPELTSASELGPLELAEAMSSGYAPSP